MDNNTFTLKIDITAKTVAKVAFGWYAGKLMFDLTAGVINLLATKATKIVEEKTPNIKVVKETEE